MIYILLNEQEVADDVRGSLERLLGAALIGICRCSNQKLRQRVGLDLYCIQNIILQEH